MRIQVALAGSRTLQEILKFDSGLTIGKPTPVVFVMGSRERPAVVTVGNRGAVFVDLLVAAKQLGAIVPMISTSTVVGDKMVSKGDKVIDTKARDRWKQQFTKATVRVQMNGSKS